MSSSSGIPSVHNTNVNIFTTLAPSATTLIAPPTATAAAAAAVDSDPLPPPLHADTEAWLRMRVAVNDLLALVAAALLERTGE